MQLQAASAGRDVAVQLRPNVVQLTVESGDMTPLSGGFGFVVGEEEGYLYVVTAKHVVRVDKPDVEAVVYAKFYERKGESFEARILDVSFVNLDLALLKVKKPFEEYTWQAKCYAEPEVADPVWFIGRSEDWFVPIAPGYVLEQPFLGKFSVEELEVEGGCSGAPLISEEGIVGMIIQDDGVDVIALSIKELRHAVEVKWTYSWGLCECIPTPKVKLFTIEPLQVTPGTDDTVQLTWEVEQADTVTIEPRIGTVDVEGSLDVVAPKEDTVYTLVAKNEGGQTKQSVEVTIVPPVPPVATIRGRIYYNGHTVTEYTDAPAILTRFYRPESLEDVPVEFHYNDQTGEFVFENVPPGKYCVGIYIDSGYPFGSHSAGDFDGFLSGWNDDIIVPPHRMEVSWDYSVVHQIHLRQPVDNQELRTSVGDLPETLYGPGFAPSAETFAWEPVPGASYYEVRILLMDGDTDESFESRSETVTATRYSPNLSVTSENEYCMFSVSAYNAQHELVGDFSNFYINGSDGWFKFKVLSRPD